MHEYTSKVRIWDLSCPGLREEVSRARQWVRGILADSPHVDDAALIVTELGTNALLHSSSGNGAGIFRILLVRSPGTVDLSVTDTGRTRTMPHLAQPDSDEPGGRGLGLVHALAQRVHISGDDWHGHTVTVELTPSKPQAPTELSDSGGGAC